MVQATSRCPTCRRTCGVLFCGECYDCSKRTDAKITRTFEGAGGAVFVEDLSDIERDRIERHYGKSVEALIQEGLDSGPGEELDGFKEARLAVLIARNQGALEFANRLVERYQQLINVWQELRADYKVAEHLDEADAQIEIYRAALVQVQLLQEAYDEERQALEAKAG